MAQAWYEVTVIGIINESQNTRRYFFEFDNLDHFDFKSGQFVKLEIKEGLRGINESGEKQRYEYIWLTPEKRIAKSYAPDGIILGFAIPPTVVRLAHTRYPGQVGFPCSIGLENLEEITHWNRTREQVSELKEDFKKWNPQFVQRRGHGSVKHTAVLPQCRFRL